MEMEKSWQLPSGNCYAHLTTVISFLVIDGDLPREAIGTAAARIAARRDAAANPYARGNKLVNICHVVS